MSIYNCILCYHANLPQLLCGIQVYIKFAGSVVIILRRWLEADTIDSDNDQAQADYLSIILRRRVEPRKILRAREEDEREVKELMTDNGLGLYSICYIVYFIIIKVYKIFMA